MIPVTEIPLLDDMANSPCSLTNSYKVLTNHPVNLASERTSLTKLHSLTDWEIGESTKGVNKSINTHQTYFITG